MKKLCVFGDSLAKGVFFDNARNKYLALKNSFVNLVGSTLGFEVKNYARFGSGIQKGLETVSNRADELNGYDYVAFEFGGNDADFNWDEISAEPDRHHDAKTPIDRYVECYYEILDRAKQTSAEPVILNLPPMDPYKYFNFISQGRNAENILKWLGGSQQYIYQFHETYNLKLHEIALKSNVKIIDIRSELLKQRNYSDFLCDDGTHLNERGNELVAETICKTVQRYVERSAAAV